MSRPPADPADLGSQGWPSDLGGVTGVAECFYIFMGEGKGFLWGKGRDPLP